MKQIYVIVLFIVTGLFVNAQSTAQNMIKSQSGNNVQIGGYAQIDFNQPLESGTYYNSNLDVHRLVLLFGYRFTEKTRFVSEIELEHVKEVFVEQAFLNHEFSPWLQLRAGLMLVPMGIINEFHEPATFNGVERPNVDSKIIPTTWREIGVGFTGRFDAISTKYQLYMLNGFNGYDGSGVFRGSDGFRKGRQKGAESFMNSPNITAKIDFYGLPGLKLGLSGYIGNSQSILYDGIDKNNDVEISRADSSVVGISMLGADARYNSNGFEARAQLNLVFIRNTAEYNAFTGNDLGSSMNGWYLETGYNILHSTGSVQRLKPFVRYEQYNTHAKTKGGLDVNKAYNRTDITFGIGWWLASGAVLKADYQVFKNKASEKSMEQFNLGVGIWF